MAASTGGVLGGVTAFSVRAMVVVWLINPAVAMTVTFVVPEVTVLDAVSVSRLAPPVLGLLVNVAETPLGRLLTLNV